MFLARRPVVKMSHQCVHESFFEDYYRPDGNVEHAMERFYFYVSECLKYKNVFIVMFLGGLWHGASFNFILWGMFHGFLLIISDFFKNCRIFIPKFLKILFIFIFVSLLWILFRSENIEYAKFPLLPFLFHFFFFMHLGTSVKGK